uniref:proline--tRNA ligase n=1 Tax=Strigamia maritima TaxID=126957 RepID=T1J9G0_STRMM
MANMTRKMMQIGLNIRRNHHVNKLSQFFPSPAMSLDDKKTDKTTTLMLNYGLIRASSPGMYHLMPLAVRSMEKLTNLVDKMMRSIGCQKIEMTSILPRELLETSGRWNALKSDLFKLDDRNNHSYILAPTHEEAAMHLLKSAGNFMQYLPLKITNKFRDEMNPEKGLIRAKQFLMKDLYSFDETEELALQTYDLVNEAYQSFFSNLGLNVIKVKAANAAMGGTLSHEYHVISEAGDDRLLVCPDGHFAANEETLDNGDLSCAACGHRLEKKNGIELGHTFLLGTRYSEPFQAVYKRDNQTIPVQMASYGLGLTRILATAISVYSLENQIRWPEQIAPYRMCIIAPKKGSKEEKAASNLVQLLYEKQIQCPGWEDEVVIDDRTMQTIGKRLIEAQKLGFPYIVVVGKKVLDSHPKVEIHHLTTGTTTLTSPEDFLNYTNHVKVPIKAVSR